MTKGSVTLPWRVVVGREAFFITLGGPSAVLRNQLLESTGGVSFAIYRIRESAGVAGPWSVHDG
jgi:hypothetical protein